MARKKTAEVEVPQEEPMALCMGETLEAIDEQIESDIAKPRSVVRSAYKEKYRDRAVEAGTARKAAKRSTWDWLAQTLAGECLVGKDRIDIDRFLAVLDANAVDHSRWTNRAKGWEGRLRMTGRLALQRVVAEAGTLSLPDGETRGEDDEVARRARWLGLPPASEERIAAMEERLGRRMPPSYRRFLEVSDGWRHAGGRWLTCSGSCRRSCSTSSP